MTERLARRTVVLGAALALAGCSGDGRDAGADATTTEPTGGAGTTEPAGAETTTPKSENPALGDVEQVGDLSLSSPAFADGGEIPTAFTRDGENVNPPLAVENEPVEAESLTLIVDDPDAAGVAGEVWLHWLVWNVPTPVQEIPRNWNPSNATVGVNDFGNRRYDGPDPPDGEHTYRFKCFALDGTLAAPDDASKREIGEAMTGRVLAQTQLTGTYAPE